MDTPLHSSAAVISEQAPSRNKKYVSLSTQEMDLGAPVSTWSLNHSRAVLTSDVRGFKLLRIMATRPMECKAILENLPKIWASANSSRDRRDSAICGSKLSSSKICVNRSLSSSFRAGVFPTLKLPYGTSSKLNSTPRAWKTVEKGLSFSGLFRKLPAKRTEKESHHPVSLYLSALGADAYIVVVKRGPYQASTSYADRLDGLRNTKKSCYRRRSTKGHGAAS